MSKRSAAADGRTPVSEAHDGEAQSARFREVADRVDSEFDRYWKMRKELRERFSKRRRSVVGENPN